MAKPVKEKQEGAAAEKPAAASAYADFAEAMAGNPLLAQSTAAIAAATAMSMSIAGQFAGAFFGALQGALEAQSRMTGSSPEQAQEAPQAPKPEAMVSAAAAVPAEKPKAKRKPAARVSVKNSQMSAAKPASGAEAKKPAVRKAKATASDDLKRIAGIGPKLERVLNTQGITSVSQIAAWKDADVARFDEALGLDGRIGRDDWVAQARKLAN